ncbi:MAG TPA: hypothetical protein VN372_03710 [Methanospirillum sp.]|nr:hypothetical protein [Methanospirillum sp.]
MVNDPKSARSGAYTPGSLTTLYTNASSTLHTAMKQLEVYNANVGALAVEIYITTGADVAVRTLFNSTIPAGMTIINDGLYWIDPLYKLRYKITGGSSGDVQLEATLMENVTTG